MPATPDRVSEGMSDLLTIATERLTLTALTPEALGAWLDGDPEALAAETGAAFEDPVRVPPLFEEDLAAFRDEMLESSDEPGWWAWLVSHRGDKRPLGVCGLGGRPVDGVVTLGYSVYPEVEGQGFATEASQGLLGWIWAQVGVEVVRAYVPTWNLGSVAVANKLGMLVVGHEVSEEVGEVAIYEVRRA